MVRTVNAVRGLQVVFGKSTTQLNKGNLNVRKAIMDLDIVDIENVDMDTFNELVEYFGEIKSGKYVIPTDYDVNNVDFTVAEKSTAKKGEKKGTIAQLRAFIEEKGLTDELTAFVNQ